jgi:sugar phosphate permease
LPLPIASPDQTYPAPSDASQRPTRVRYAVLALAVTMAVLLYLDRMAISVALPAIAEDLDLQISQAADSVAAFFWCYALCQIPAGWLGDRWGPRKALSLYVVAWSLAVAGMGLATGLVSLVVMRALLGIGQAGAYATTAGMLRRWIPFTRRGLANSAVSLGGRAGGVLAPAATSLLMRTLAGAGMENERWRPVFVGYGCLGLIWTIFFWRWVRDDPRRHAATNAAERALIRAGETAPDSASVGSIPLRALITSRGLQLLSLENFAVNVGWIFVGTLLPTYLIAQHAQSEVQAGLAASLTAAAGMAGCLSGGLATDWLVKRLGLPWGRRLPGLISCGGAAVVYAGCWSLDDPNAIVAALVVASFFGDFALGAMWATCQDIGASYAGTVLGAANMFGNIGAAVAASLIARLASHFGWPATFVLSAVAYSVGAASWLLIDPRVPVLSAEQPISPEGNFA